MSSDFDDVLKDDEMIDDAGLPPFDDEDELKDDDLDFGGVASDDEDDAAKHEFEL